MTINCRLCRADSKVQGLEQFDEIFTERVREADAFYDDIIPEDTTPEERLVFRDGYAGLLWTRLF